MLVGYNNKSHDLAIQNNSIFFNCNLVTDIHDIFTTLSPELYCFGAAIGGTLIFCMRNYDHRNICRNAAIIFMVCYTLISIYPHIVILVITRIALGIGCGMASLVIPQTLYSLALVNKRGRMSSLFATFMLLGYTISTALLPFSGTYRIFLDVSPILISAIVIFLNSNIYS